MIRPNRTSYRKQRPIPQLELLELRLGKYGRRMDPCAKIEAGARIHVSEGMVKDVTVMKYEENG